MAEDPGKQKEKLEFTSEGEALGYISLDQARVLAMRTAAETPGAYGSSFADQPMAFEVVEAEETEDHYVITLAFRPQGEYAGRPGREQFFIEKEGSVAHRQVLALPKQKRRFPLNPVGIALAAIGVVAIILVFVIPNIGGDKEVPPSVAVVPTDPPEPATATTGGRKPQVPPPTEAVLPGSPDTQPTSTPSPAVASGTAAGTSILQPLDGEAGLVHIPLSHRGILEINANQSVAQSFTVPSDGLVTGAEIIGLSHDRCTPTKGLDFRLLITIDGKPSEPARYAEVLPPTAVREDGGAVEITFGPDGWPVGAFESMALEISSEADPTGCAYSWDGDSPGGYSGGQAFISSQAGFVWSPMYSDMGFRVFFQPEAAIQSAESDIFTFEDDFEGGAIGEWSNGTTNTAHTDNFTEFLGNFGNETVLLILNDLPTHSEVHLQFDLYLLDSWHGDTFGCFSCGPDSFRVGFGNSLTNLMDETYGGDQALSRCDHLGFNPGFCDTIYENLGDGFSFPHTGETLILNFSALGLQELDDESWGIDNVKVTLTLDNGVQLPPGAQALTLTPTPLPTPTHTSTPIPRSTPTPTVTPAPVPTPTPTATSTPVPTPTPSQTPIPTATPAPAPTLTPSFPYTIATFKGAGDTSTKTFEVTGSPWQIKWSIKPGCKGRVGDRLAYDFQVVLFDPRSGTNVEGIVYVDAEIQPLGEKLIYAKVGSFYLNIYTASGMACVWEAQILGNP